MRSIIRSFVMAISFLIMLNSGCAQAQLQVDTSWPDKPERFEWAQMPGITLDDEDQVYIFTRSSPAVQIGTSGCVCQAERECRDSDRDAMYRR